MQRWGISQLKTICIDIKAMDSRGAILELAQMMKGWYEIGDFDKFVYDILTREALQPTGIGDEVALPHARSSSVNKFVMVFGRSKNGIDFGALDGKPARLIFLMGIPVLQIRGYLQLVRNLSMALKNDKMRQDLCEATDESRILEIFNGEYNRRGTVSVISADAQCHG